MNNVLPHVIMLDFTSTPYEIELDDFQGILDYRWAFHRMEQSADYRFGRMREAFRMPVHVQLGNSTAADVMTIFPGDTLRLNTDVVPSVKLIVDAYEAGAINRISQTAEWYDPFAPVAGTQPHRGMIVHASELNYELRK